MYQSITEEAWTLVHSLASQCGSDIGLGTMSPAAYDTAWVAMTEKEGEDGKRRPLFPEAYEYLKQTQSDDGSWAAETSDADGIVNTLAALLALKHQERQYEAAMAENHRRCEAAETALRRMLGGWNLEAADRVGLEILVPNLLRLLEAEGVNFEFPSRKPLMALNEAKLARLGPVLTSPVQTTLVHTLEAFVGTLDFDKVKQHKMPNGSMLASPSSTAAYLMNSSSWDLEAEAYLRNVYQVQTANGHKGGFPSAFPSTIFEISWVLDTLFEAGFDKDEFLLADIRKLTVFLESNLKAQNGIVGFLPSALPDADDTAKTISTLRLLGWDKDVAPMLKAFEAEKSFITYRGERNASSSANCNILLCLLRAPEPAKHTNQIVKAVAFLSRFWMDNNGPDKWHTSVHYPMMLIAQAFMLFLKRWGKQELDNDQVPKKLINQDVPRTLLEILARTMALQQADGSWESKREVTAYAVLTLAPLLSLPWVDFLKPEGIACMYRGKAYLEDNRHQWRDAERLWIEKTVYSSSNLCQAYCLAASKIVVPTAFMSQKVVELFPSQLNKKVAKMSSFFSRVEPFSEAPRWKMQLSLLQCAPYAAALRDARYMVIPPIENASDEKYQEYIPFTWIGCRDFLGTAIPGETLWQMMIVSMLGFQVDAYMETVVWEQYQDRLPELKALIRRLCTGSGSSGPRKRKSNGEIGGTPKKLLGPKGVPNGVHSATTNGSNAHANGSRSVDLVQTGSSHCSSDTNGASNGDTKVQMQDTRAKRVDSLINDGTPNGNEQASDRGRNDEVPNGTNEPSHMVNDTNGISEVKGLNGAHEVRESNGVHTSKEPNGVHDSNGMDNADCVRVAKGSNGSSAIHPMDGPITTNGDSSANGVNGFKKPVAPTRQLPHDEEQVAESPVSEGTISAEEMLTRTVNFVLGQPKVLQSPQALQAWLAHELQAYLLAHITHLEDVAELARSLDASKGPFTWDNPRTTFFDWVRSTSAEHTSCTYAFVFFLCLISDNGANIAGTVHQRYALEDACSHLATMCRQYNDFGSMARDQDERNLNSVNFPEFNLGMPTSNTTSDSLYEQKKKDLLTVAQYERRCLNRVVGELEGLLDAQTMEKLRLFIQVTDFYGHIYVARDIGVRVGA